MADRLAADKRNLAVKSERLWGLSPLKKISGGFGFITDGDGKRLETVEQAEARKTDHGPGEGRSNRGCYRSC